MWSRIYCKSVDSLFKRNLIRWQNHDPRGEFFSMITSTEEGRKVYDANATKDKDRVLV